MQQSAPESSKLAAQNETGSNAGGASGDLARAVRKYRDGQESAIRLRRLRTVLTLALVAVILGYLVAFYSTARSMYDPQKFEEPIRSELKRLEPSIRNSASNALERIQPVLGQKLSEGIQEIRPQLERSVQYECETLAHIISDHANEEIERSLRRIYYRQSELLEKHFPRLNDEQRRELLRKRIENDLRVDMDDILVDFQKSYVNDVRSMEATLQKFRPNRFERFSKEELSQYFIHLWLMLLDQHLLESIGGK